MCMQGSTRATPQAVIDAAALMLEVLKVVQNDVYRYGLANIPADTMKRIDFVIDKARGES